MDCYPGYAMQHSDSYPTFLVMCNPSQLSSSATYLLKTSMTLPMIQEIFQTSKKRGTTAYDGRNRFLFKISHINSIHGRLRLRARFLSSHVKFGSCWASFFSQSMALSSQSGRLTGQSEHVSGFQNTAAPQMGLETVTAVIAGWKHWLKALSGHATRPTGQSENGVTFGAPLHLTWVWQLP